MPILKPKMRSVNHCWDHNDFRKLTIMTVWRKIQEAFCAQMMLKEEEEFVDQKDYQGAFKAHHSTIGRIFIVLTMIFSAFVSNFALIVLVLVDFSQYFDTIRRELLGLKLQENGYSKKLQRLNWRTMTNHRVRVLTKNRVSRPLKLKVGMAQGSSWSPKKANVFADKIATAGADVKTNVPKILERRDNTICYADDLLSAALKMATAQILFEKIEKASLEDGADISYKKTILKVLCLDKTRQRKNTWHLVGQKGCIYEDIEQFVLYLGFWIR